MKLCRTCRYGRMYELDKPCIVYREDCPLYQKEGEEMTNEEAIEELKAIKSTYSNKAFGDSRLMRSEIEALDMAIKALEQEPSGDLISRQYLLDNCVVDKVTMPYVPISKIQEAPSVTPQEPKADRGLHLSQQFKDWQFIQGQKTGNWILDETDNSITCDKCGCLIWANDISNGEAYYCPNCGAKMVESQESEEV